MKKQEFLDALRVGLTGSGDAEEVLDFYREMIEDRMEDGMEEEAAVEQLGSVEAILARCVQGLTVTQAAPEAGMKTAMATRSLRTFTPMWKFRNPLCIPSFGGWKTPGS